ncbi:retinol dehydrogenase 12-like [Dreissena polymorpha]|uniref:retinol dehydrogenase 12-like n=1 Tax=Dreissena polymorpha TaxID=45954 RepID=UPI0022650796|nr:retinol dehydrogenase 12-like [Dreissena polymorpha]
MDQFQKYSVDVNDFLYTHRVSVAVTITTACALFALRRYLQGGVCRSTVKLHNRTVLITGANTGIGRETARDLAIRGARVILACRDMKRAQEAADDIKRSTGNLNVVVYKLDLASLESVRDCVKEVLQNEDRLDILINNAGVVMMIYCKTKDGFEMQLGTNHLGHFLFTNLLLDLVKKSAPSRIINVSSRAHMNGRINLEDLNGEQTYRPFYAYAQSKLANILFTRELDRRLKGTGVTVVSLHPGGVVSDLGMNISRELPIYFRLPVLILYHGLIRHLMKTTTAGAQTTLHCALAPEVEQQSGKYFSDCAVLEPTALAQDDAMASKLWSVSEKMVGLTQ